jgi:hypothetical protein
MKALGRHRGADVHCLLRGAFNLIYLTVFCKLRNLHYW